MKKVIFGLVLLSITMVSATVDIQCMMDCMQKYTYGMCKRTCEV
jgi:hypothetical protein